MVKLKMICTHSKESDQPGHGHPPSLFRILAVCLKADNKISNQTGQVPRLIQVITGCRGHFEGYAIHFDWGKFSRSFG